MMPTPQQDLRLRLGLQNRLNAYQLLTYAIPARIGDGQGNVAVSGRPGYIYVRTDDQVIPCLNVRLPSINNYPVMVGYDYLNPDTFQVLDTNLSAVAFGDSGEIIYSPLTDHHETHEYLAGHDVVQVHLRAFMPLRVYPKTGFTVTVFRGVAPTATGGWVVIATTDIDLSSEQPASGYCWVLVYVDETGALATLTGTTILDASFSLDDAPEPLPGTFPLAAVRLYDSQTEIEENTTTTDIVDLRFLQSWFAGPETADDAKRLIWMGW